MLTREQTRAFYDWFGAKQDWQRFYEDRALDDLMEHSALAEAKSVVEFGCGTGRLAEQLLAQRLPPDAHYLGTDMSPTMVKLARVRLARFGSRAQVLLTTGESRLDVPAGRFDRFFSTYVLDLLGEEEIHAVTERSCHERQWRASRANVVHDGTGRDVGRCRGAAQAVFLHAAGPGLLLDLPGRHGRGRS